jgi:hypothetical protein
MTALPSRFPLGVLPTLAARRDPPRRAGNFLLLAQKKVTKEEGLNASPFEWLAAAGGLLQRLWLENIQRTTLAVTSLMFSRSSSFRLDPAGPRLGGMQRSVRPSAVQSLPSAGGSSRATGAAAKAKPVAAHPLGFSVTLPMGRPRQSACSRSEQAKWAGVQALCFGDFHLGQQMKATRQPGRDPAGSLAERNPSGSPAGNQRCSKQNPAGSVKGSTP